MQTEHVEHLFIKEFGVSSEEFERQLAAEFELASPEEQAELKRLVDEANAVLPKMDASLDRIGKHVASIETSLGEMHQHVASMAMRLDSVENKLVGSVHHKHQPPFPESQGIQ
jgi:uncharacterized coiled-coil protein SlyX